MADSLTCRLAVRRLCCRRSGRIALQQLFGSTTESEIRRPVNAIREITSNRSYRGAIPYSKTYRVNHVIKVLEITLLDAERYVAYRAIHITHIVKQHTLYVWSQKRKPKFDIVE